MKKRCLLLPFFLLAVLITHNSCGRSETAARHGKDHLIVVLHVSPASLDPSASGDRSSSIVMRQIYDTLVNLDENMRPLPNLAERWAFENDSNGEPSQIRLFLKQNVKFHSGELFNAQDVKFSLAQAAKMPHNGEVLNMIRSVDIVTDYEVLITMAYPFAPILNHLSCTTASITSEKAALEQDGDYGKNPIGTGPMKLAGWIDDTIELTRWDEYHGEAPHLKDITIRIIADREERLSELESGAVDLVIDILPEDISRIKGNSDLQLIRIMNFSTNYIGVNCQKPPFNDVRVRRAVAHALDLDALEKSVYLGSGGAGSAPINSKIWASAEDRLKRIEYNPEKARELLSEAGYSGGFSTNILLNDTPQRIEIAEVVKNMLAAIDVKVEIRLADWTAYLDMTARGGHEMFILGWVTVTGDPDYGLRSTFHSSNFGAGGNRSFYSNTEVDRLFDAGRIETDPAKREQLYIQAQEIIHNEAVWIVQWPGEDLNGAVKNLRGFKNHPAGRHELWTILFE